MGFTRFSPISREKQWVEQMWSLASDVTKSVVTSEMLIMPQWRLQWTSREGAQASATFAALHQWAMFCESIIFESPTQNRPIESIKWAGKYLDIYVHLCAFYLDIRPRVHDWDRTTAIERVQSSDAHACHAAWRQSKCSIGTMTKSAANKVKVSTNKDCTWHGQVAGKESRRKA